MKKADVITLLDAYRCTDDKERDDADQMKEFVKSHEDFYQRANKVGHLTASAWVIDTMLEKTLLTHHKKLDKWLQIGGHIEERDRSLLDAARREVVEESGIYNVEAFFDDIFDVDIHLIPEYKGTPEHYHYDVRFIFVANTKEFKVSSESFALEWFYFDKAKEVVDDMSLLRMIEKTEQLQQ